MGTPAVLAAAERATLLVVEDDAGIATLERRRLERAGYAVVTAADAAAARERVSQGGIDLIVLDHSLPGGMTGLDLYGQLRAAGHHLPVIMVTGQSNEATVIQALRLGVSDFVPKSPAYLDYLPEAVGRVLWQVRTERRLAASEQRFRATFEQAAVGIAHIALDGRWVLVNQKLCEIVDLERQALLARPWSELLHPDDRAAEAGDRERLLADETIPAAREQRAARRDGTVVWVNRTLSLVRDRSGRPQYFMSVAEDITARKRLEAQLVHQAFHDSLTHLPNRALFLDRLDHALARTSRHPGSIAVLFVDLDRFKVVNDRLGHEAGDRVLVAVAERLRACVRGEDTVARLAGDEFTILLEELAGLHDVTAIAVRILEALRAPIPCGAQDVVLNASIGIATSTAEHRRGTELLRDADVAMYRAKQTGKARFALFDARLNAETARRLDLETELRQAAEREELLVYYQPEVALAQGRIIGVEALVRWAHPRRGLVSPGEFIPLAEETGLIRPIGRWVLHAACRQARAWHARRPSDPPIVSVNLSGRQLQQAGLADDVACVLRDTGLAADRLVLEITESVLMETAEANVATLRRLKALGVQLAIDDFGTGYSSLSYLKRFPVDLLKVDRAFVAGLGSDCEDTAIVQAVITLAHTLGLQVVAEGVETATHLKQLRALGCEFGQGYYFAKPLPADLATSLLGGGL